MHIVLELHHLYLTALSVKVDDCQEECGVSSFGTSEVNQLYGASGCRIGTDGSQGCAFCDAFGLMRP